jgi:hypothetical protein
VWVVDGFRFQVSGFSVQAVGSSDDLAPCLTDGSSTHIRDAICFVGRSYRFDNTCGLGRSPLSFRVRDKTSGGPGR